MFPSDAGFDWIHWFVRRLVTRYFSAAINALHLIGKRSKMKLTRAKGTVLKFLRRIRYVKHTWVLLVLLIFCATKVQHGRVKYESVTVSFLPRRMLASSDDLSDVIRIKLGIHFKGDIHSSVPGQPGTANRLRFDLCLWLQNRNDNQ